MTDTSQKFFSDLTAAVLFRCPEEELLLIQMKDVGRAGQNIFQVMGDHQNRDLLFPVS